MEVMVNRSCTVTAGLLAGLCLVSAAHGIDFNAPDRWWKFDEGSGTDITDSSGNDVHGTLVNADDSAWVDGMDGSALAFDGADDHVVIPDNDLPAAGYYASADGDFTLAFWMRISAEAQMSLIRRSTEDAAWWANCRAIHIKKDGTNPMYLEGYVWDGTNEYATGSTALQTDTWYHATLVCDVNGGSESLRIFLDGSLEATAWFGTQHDWPQDLWFIGRPVTDAKQQGPFCGVIDDVRIFNSVLTDQEVADLFAEMAKPIVSIAATDGEASESGPDTGAFLVTRQLALTAITVNLDYLSGSTATYGSDYTTSPEISGGIPMDVGVDQVEIVITPNADAEYAEGDEYVVVNVAPGADYAVGTSDSPTVTISDYVPPPPESFALTGPANGSHNVGVTPTLTWEASVGAVNYSVAIYDDDGLTSEVHSAVVSEPDTSYDVPASTLEFDVQYWWTVTAESDPGDTMVATPTSGFTFDTSVPGAPTARTSPADGEGDVDTGTAVTTSFNEPVIVAGLADVVAVDGVTGSVASQSSYTIVFTPDDDLEFGTTYTVTVQPTGSGSSVVDQAAPANAFNSGSEYVFTFTTWDELSGLASGEGCVPGAGVSAVALALAACALAAGALRRQRR